MIRNSHKQGKSQRTTNEDDNTVSHTGPLLSTVKENKGPC